MKNRLFPFLLLLFCASVSYGGYIGYLYPAGAKAGTTCEIIAGGRGLESIRSVIVDGKQDKTVTVVSVECIPGGLYNYPNPEQRRFVDRAIRASFQGKKGPDLPKDTTGWKLNHRWFREPGKLAPMQREMLVRGFFTRPDPLQASPSIARKAIIRLRIDPKAKKGMHHLRFIGNMKRPAVFNPVPFFIGGHPEIQEPFMLPPPAKPPVPNVRFPAVLNGQIFPGETDLFRFQAKKGEKLSFRLYGRALLPFIGDGVPGHFQPVLQILDSRGREAAFQDDTYFDPDPVLNFTAPAGGEYTLAVRDAIYRGRDDFVYRIAVTRGVTSYQLLNFPSWGLPVVKAEEPDAKVPFPSAAEGTILPGKKQKFSFVLNKGTKAVLEVWARRSLSPLDSLLRLYGPDGKQLAMNDDFPRPKIGSLYHHADSYIRFTAPQSGTYAAELSDTAGKGGKDYRYRLRIDIPRPDFRIWAVPSGVELPGGAGVTPVGLVVERLDGHTGDITIRTEGCRNIVIAGSNTVFYGPKHGNSFESVCGLQLPFPDCTKCYLTLALQGWIKSRLASFRMTARSGKTTHPVIPADESMQAFAYNHLIPADEFRAATVWRNVGKFFWKQNPAAVLQLSPGSETELEIKSEEVIVKDSCTAELFAPPAGLTLTGCREANGKVFLRLKADPSMKPARFNQVIRLDFLRERKNKGTVKKIKGSVYMPALPVEIRAK